MSPADETSVTTSDAGTVRGGPLAHKINYLFETVRRPDGKSYSNEEVAEAITELGEATISGTYLWYLRRGDRDNPTKKHLEVLARFFGVSPAYFFDDAPGLPHPRAERAQVGHPPAMQPPAARSEVPHPQHRPPEAGHPQADWLAEASPGTTHPGMGHPPGASPGHHPADYSTGPHTIGQHQSTAHGTVNPPGTHPGAHPSPTHSSPTHGGPTHGGPHESSAHPGAPYSSAAHGTVWPDDDGRWVAALLHGLSPRSLRAVADVISRVRELEGLPVTHPGPAFHSER